MMRALGQAADEDVLEGMMREILGDKDGQITFRDYCNHMGQKGEEEKSARTDVQNKRIFSIIDRDGDGVISKADIDHFVRGRPTVPRSDHAR